MIKEEYTMSSFCYSEEVYLKAFSISKAINLYKEKYSMDGYLTVHFDNYQLEIILNDFTFCDFISENNVKLYVDVTDTDFLYIELVSFLNYLKVCKPFELKNDYNQEICLLKSIKDVENFFEEISSIYWNFKDDIVRTSFYSEYLKKKELCSQDVYFYIWSRMISHLYHYYNIKYPIYHGPQMCVLEDLGEDMFYTFHNENKTVEINFKLMSFENIKMLGTVYDYDKIRNFYLNKVKNSSLKDIFKDISEKEILFISKFDIIENDDKIIFRNKKYYNKYFEIKSDNFITKDIFINLLQTINSQEDIHINGFEKYLAGQIF